MTKLSNWVLQELPFCAFLTSRVLAPALETPNTFLLAGFIKQDAWLHRSIIALALFGQGLLLWRHSLLVQPGAVARFYSADAYTTSSPNCSNTHVCVQVSCLCDESRSLDGRSGATFTIKPVECCVALRGDVVNDAAGGSVRAERIVKRLRGLDNCYRCKKKRCT